jgi:molecular chaperone GrpE
MSDPAQQDANHVHETPNPAESGEDLAQRLAAAEAKAEENRDQYLRAAAELENVRRRAQRDVENAYRYALEKFVQELLNVKDSLERGLEIGDAGGQADVKSVLAGKEATLRLLEQLFQKFGITPLDPLGEPFDPQKHEAMAVQESSTAEPDTVLQVVQKGYELNGRLLRPARVIVSKAPAAPAKSAE